nr:NlpC/P60 family protein [uncultured Albidiferax sp.]
MINITAFLAELQTWEGVLYHHQGRNRHGVDCVGLGLAALQAQGVVVDAPTNYSRAAQGQALLTHLEASGLLKPLPLDTRAPGDILVFRIRENPQHVGIALAADRMIHADAGNGVRSVTLSPLWIARIVARYGWSE